MDSAEVAAIRAANAARGLDRGDLDPDPIVQFRQWFDGVLTAGLPEPYAMVLATAPAGAGAQPLARHVLLRAVDDDDFTWASDRRSRKGRHLDENPRAALVFPWFPVGRQVIVTGAAAEAAGGESDAAYAARPRESQLAAWASEQSAPIPDRGWLESRWQELEARFERGPVPRPPHWLLYRLAPTTIEFWQHRDHRLHDRFLYERPGPGEPWSVTRLAP